jgi:neurotensin receptor 1
MSRNPCISNESRLIYSDALHDVEVAGYRYVILTICIFGVVCNMLNLCVLLQPRLKESPYTYLTGLAVADMLTLISISPFSIVRGDYIRHENIFFALTRFECQFYMPLANYFGQVSIMITLALTIERYLFTTYPLRTRSFCKARYARIVIGIILILCALLSFPRFLLETVTNIVGPEHSFNSSTCSTHPFIIRYSSTNSSHTGQCFCVTSYPRKAYFPYRNAYYITMFIFNQILPAFILLFLNLKLIQRVQQSNRYTLNELVARQHNHLASSTPIIPPIKQKRLRDEHRLTKTLVAVVVIFLICNTFTIISYPDLVRKITSKKYPNYIYIGFRIQKLITNIMLLLNYSINFFLYCAFNQKFLDTLKTTFRQPLCSYKFFRHHSDSISTQGTLFNSRASSINSSYYSQSKIHNLSKIDSNFDVDFPQRKQFCLKTFKDAL